VGIARLLLHERRPKDLIETACHMAVECACRAALSADGRRFEGDLLQAFEALTAPADLLTVWRAAAGAAERVQAAERVLEWTAAYLRQVAPQRRWGC
jgi:hypothetical protein